jgi:hypothetical protein
MRDLLFDLLVGSGKKLPPGSAKDSDVAENRFQARFSRGAFITRYFRSGLTAQKKCHLVLRETVSFAVGPQIILQFRRHEKVGSWLLRFD